MIWVFEHNKWVDSGEEKFGEMNRFGAEKGVLNIYF